jgi:RND family efflux transporter MFP subunit
MRGFSAVAIFAAVVASGSPAAASEHDCLIEPHKTVDVRASAEGVLKEVLVDRGDRVRQGQVLALLESGPEQAANVLAKYRAETESALNAANTRLAFAKRKAQRMDDLQKQNFVSAQARDEAFAELGLAEAQEKEARENKRIAQLEELRSGAILNQRTVTSPVTGIVVERGLHAGEVVTNDSKRSIFRLAVLDPLHVEVVVPVAKYGSIKPGMRAEIIPEVAVTKGKLFARVKIIDRTVDAPSGTFGVRLELANPDYKVPSGIKCKARFPD